MMTETAHRPWPLPSGLWVLAMRWHDLVFLHWPMPANALRPRLPSSLALDTFDGRAWLGVVPFRMTGVRPRYVPALPWVSAFPELNVRTYVTTGGKPGVWFFSLDAANPVAVWMARWLYALPYYVAQMSVTHSQGPSTLGSPNATAYTARIVTVASGVGRFIIPRGPCSRQKLPLPPTPWRSHWESRYRIRRRYATLLTVKTWSPGDRRVCNGACTIGPTQKFRTQKLVGSVAS